MSLAVLVAVADGAIEQRLVAAFARPGAGVFVARRCVDLPDLLAAAGSGTARAAVVAGVRRFDGEAVSRLRGAGVGVVALAVDEQDERTLRGMGVARVLPADAAADAVEAALFDAAHSISEGSPAAKAASAGEAGPFADVLDLEALEAAVTDAEIARGEVIAVWGPAGAPGRSLLATALASELAILGRSTLLIDADVYAASIAQSIGLVDEVPGFAAAARDANLGVLDAGRLAGHARAVGLDRIRTQVAPGGSLRVLTGLPRADRWPELRPDSVARVLELARVLCAVTVIDCSACLESDEELSYDVPTPRRNGATLAVLEAADRVIAIGAADPVGLSRLVRGLADLSEAVPAARPQVVVNRVRSGPVPGDPATEIRAALARFAAIEPVALLPENRPEVDAALASGRLLAEAAPSSPLRLAVRALAADLSGRPERNTRRIRGRKRGQRSVAQGPRGGVRGRS